MRLALCFEVVLTGASGLSIPCGIPLVIRRTGGLLVRWRTATGAARGAAVAGTFLSVMTTILKDAPEIRHKTSTDV